MAELFNPHHYKKLLIPPVGLFDVSYSALSDGSLAILRSDHNVLSNWRHNLKDGANKKEVLGEKGRGFLFLSEGDIEWPVFEFSLETPFPLFEKLPDGGWIFVKSRCGFAEDNAVCYTSSGEVWRRFNVGDAVEHIQCDAYEMLWIGYFDEGYYRNRGWNKTGKRSSFDITGLVRLDLEGSPYWASPVPILDCYALNVYKSAAWVYYYPDFNILKINQDGIQKTWKTGIEGAKALAVAGNFALLAGGYGDDFDRVVLLKLEGQEATEVITFSLNLSYVNASQGPVYFGGRGSFLHIIWVNHWIRLDVCEVCASLCTNYPDRFSEEFFKS